MGRKPGFKQTEEWKEKMKKWRSENENPFKNCHHTIETRQLMCKNHANFSGENNPFATKYYSNENFRNEFKETHLKLWESRDINWRKEFGRKVSMGQPAKTKHGNSHNYHQGHYFSKKCGLVYFRSSWELSVILSLNDLDFVKSFDVEPFRISYDINKTQRYTWIDLLIEYTNENKLLVEIKPEVFVISSYHKILGIECFCLENNIPFLIMTQDCFEPIKIGRIENFILRGYHGEFRLERFIQRGVTSPLCITSKLQ